MGAIAHPYRSALRRESQTGFLKGGVMDHFDFIAERMYHQNTSLEKLLEACGGPFLLLIGENGTPQ